MSPGKLADCQEKMPVCANCTVEIQRVVRQNKVETANTASSPWGKSSMLSAEDLIKCSLTKRLKQLFGPGTGIALISAKKNFAKIDHHHDRCGWDGSTHRTLLLTFFFKPIMSLYGWTPAAQPPLQGREKNKKIIKDDAMPESSFEQLAVFLK